MSTLSITSIQADLLWEDIPGNLNRFGVKIASLKGKTELVILPEMFSTGFSTEPKALAEKMDGRTVKWMKSMAQNCLLILTGSVIIEEEGKFYNRLIWALPDGQIGHYDKRHLFAYGGEDAKYSSGNKRLIASVKGWKINLMVCYDLRFPVWSRLSSTTAGNKEPEYDVLVYVANWPVKRIHAWKTLVQARAIENQCYVAAVNRTGKDGNSLEYPGESMMVDPMGEVLYLGDGKEDIFTCLLHKEKLLEVREKFPFWKDRDQFIIQP